MDAMTQQLMKQLSGSTLSKISKTIGADPKATGAALTTAVPVLVSALANNASKSKGAAALHQALAQDHDGSILDDITGYLSEPSAANGAGILGHILGKKQSTVNQGLAKSSGLNIGQVGQLLQIVAPLIMGMIGKQQQSKSLDTGGLTDLLGGLKQKAQEENPDLMSVLGSLLGSGSGQSGLGGMIGMLGKLMGKK
jgi:hypothetical protein